MTDQGRKEAITKQVRMVRYREQSIRDCVDNIESMIEALTIPVVRKSFCVQTGLECGFPCHSDCAVYEKLKLR
jgi:hypothetical protein